jgi:hypothetical protein
MLIQALLPEIHRRPTGGNLFNRQVLAVLETRARVERRVVGDGAPPPGEPAPAVTLVDSLVLAPAADLLRATPGARVLLAHYLHLFEPGRRDSPEAHRERRLLPLVDGVVTTSEFCRQALLREGFPAERVAAVTPGLAPVFAAELGPRPPGPPRILTVATLLEGKGLRQLTGILEGLADLDWTWEIAGDPGLDERFSAAFLEGLRRSSIAGRARFLGAVAPERMVELYDRCHLFVLPSRFETCSMATMEAMARGLAVMAYGVGGLPERLPAAAARLLAPPGDLERFAARLRQLLSDPERAAALGRANRRASRSFPSWEKSGQALWELVSRLAGLEPSRRCTSA